MNKRSNPVVLGEWMRQPALDFIYQSTNAIAAKRYGSSYESLLAEIVSSAIRYQASKA